MRYANLAVVMSLVLFIGGCVNSSTVHEKRLISPNQKIAILWNIGDFKESHISDVMLRNMTDGRAYEACTNALFERTFSANGYMARAFKGQPDPRRFADTDYVLMLWNKSAQYPTVKSAASSTPLLSSPLVLLNMEVTLYERQSAKKLWSTTETLASDATRNGYAPMRLVKALATSGFLTIKAEDVVDYRGQRTAPSDDNELGCP